VAPVLPSEKVSRLLHRCQVFLYKTNDEILECMSEYIPSCEMNINPMDTWGGGGSLTGARRAHREMRHIACLPAVHPVVKRLEVVLISFG
jgi:hypothetical protein